MSTLIFETIPKVIEDLGAVGKNKTNNAPNSGGYKYRAADDLYNALMPVLAKNKAFFVPKVLSSTEERYENSKGTQMVRKTMKINYKVFASDGSFVESEVECEAFDSSDKCTSKCMTSAFKIFASQVFCVAFETIDSEEDSPEPPKNKEDLAGTIEKLVKHFAGLGVSPKRIEDKFQSSLANLTETDIVQLRDLALEIKNGKLSVLEVFPVPNKAVK